MATESRPKTPYSVARELRQNAGFGCCRCGLPILQYHHIIPYSVEAHFRVKDMMALCPGCHDMATKHALTLEKQREHQATPFNVKRGHAAGLLALNGHYCAIQTGGVYLVNNGPLITVDGHTLLSLAADADNQLELSINLYDKKNRLVAVIEKNEWVSGDISLWDIKADYQKLTINKKHGQIELEINAQEAVVKLKARLWHNGSSIRLSSVGLTFNGAAVQNIRVADLALVNQRFEINSTRKELSIDPNEGGGVIVSEPDPALRLQKAIEAWVINHAAQ